MLDGVMLLWFLLTAAALLFVAVDIRSTPESPVLKWGFLLLTAYTGVVGAFLYVLGCREPLPGLHERYVSVRWRQTLGSTMHCVAGDGVGILAGAVIAGVAGLTGLAEVILEYVLGFAFGWTIFQALFMRDMAGGSYKRALIGTFVPELLSMNLLMAGMVPTVMMLKAYIEFARVPTTPNFWFVMSMGLLVGFVIAYPMNWWLVANHLKHGMMTVRPVSAVGGVPAHDAHAPGPEAHSAHSGAGGAPNGELSLSMIESEAPRPPVPVMAVLSFLALAAGVMISFMSQPLLGTHSLMHEASIGGRPTKCRACAITEGWGARARTRSPRRGHAEPPLNAETCDLSAEGHRSWNCQQCSSSNALILVIPHSHALL